MIRIADEVVSGGFPAETSTGTGIVASDGTGLSRFRVPNERALFGPQGEDESRSERLRSEEPELDQEDQFDALAAEWKSSSTFLSSVDEIAMQRAYQRIIGMGPVVVPLILRSLEQETDHWFWALAAITGEDPVTDEERGDMEAMATAWITWGRKKGLA